MDVGKRATLVERKGKLCCEPVLFTDLREYKKCRNRASYNVLSSLDDVVRGKNYYKIIILTRLTN